MSDTPQTAEARGADIMYGPPPAPAPETSKAEVPKPEPKPEAAPKPEQPERAADRVYSDEGPAPLASREELAEAARKAGDRSNLSPADQMYAPDPKDAPHDGETLRIFAGDDLKIPKGWGVDAEFARDALAPVMAAQGLSGEQVSALMPLAVEAIQKNVEYANEQTVSAFQTWTQTHRDAATRDPEITRAGGLEQVRTHVEAMLRGYGGDDVDDLAAYLKETGLNRYPPFLRFMNKVYGQAKKDLDWRGFGKAHNWGRPRATRR